MIQHLVLFKWKPTTTTADQAAACAALSALRDAIPGIVALTVGAQNSPEGKGKGFHTGLTVTFLDAAARDAYLPHPAHQQAVAGFRGHIEDAIVLDYAY